jgi:galactokinase
VLIGTILNFLYNDGKISAEQIAIIGQYAENNYFNKPCGLMDQMTCAVGGIVTIDFKNPAEPLVKKVNFDFGQQDYSLIVIDTGGSHADLTEDYASIPREMKSVAKELGGNVGRDVSYGAVISKLKVLRSRIGDRSILRMLHFIEDNERVVEQVAALEKNDFQQFLKLVNESGNSSNKWLQNCYAIKAPSEQGINIALAITENYIKKIREGACRVHGGGFAGTVQVFLPNRVIKDYIELINSIFGAQTSQILKVRPLGTIHFNSVFKH